ncbi:MAG: phosphotransferase family protein [Eubacterium sp.]|nr:phosphotransferase family protein [Eubacterium sp.]
MTGTELSVSRLSGGVTNVNYVVQNENQKYVVRVAGKGTNLFIDRKNEFHNVTTMSNLGIAPKIYFSDPETRFQIQEFIEQDTLTAEKIRGNNDILSACIRLLKKCHSSGADFKNRFDPWVKTETNLALLQKDGFHNYYPDWKGTVAFCKDVHSQYQAEPIDLCPCHNDTVAGNFMGNDVSMKLIDWEYSGMNDPYYDLACFSMENGLNAGDEKLMLRLHEDKEPDDKEIRRFLSMKIITAFYWSVWSLLQIKNGKNADFYYPYGMDRYRVISESRDRLHEVNAG